MRRRVNIYCVRLHEFSAASEQICHAKPRTIWRFEIYRGGAIANTESVVFVHRDGAEFVTKPLFQGDIGGFTS